MAVSANDLVVGPLTPAVGVTTISLDFYFEDAAWLQVYKGSSDTPLVLDTDYTVTGEGTVDGVVTLTVAANGTDAYSVYLVVPLQRSSDMQLRGEFKSGPFNLEMDRLWQALQGISTRLSRAIVLSRNSPLASAVVALTTAGRAGRAIIFSSDGTGLEAGPTSGEIAAAQANASAAAASAASALLSFEEFDARYLGAKAADPTLDNNGAALVAGAMYFNTASNEMRVYPGSAPWLVASISELGDLSDVDPTGALSGDGLVFDGADWVPGKPALDLGDLGDASTAGAVSGDGLVFDGTDWVPGPAGGGMFKGENGTVGSRAGDIFRINEQTLNTDVTIDATENASAAGPLVVATGVTLTVTSGGSLVIL